MLELLLEVTDLESIGEALETCEQVSEVTPISDLLPEQLEANTAGALSDVFTPEVITEWPEMSAIERQGIAETASQRLNESLGTDAPIQFRELDEGCYGYRNSEGITINSACFESGDLSELRELVDTLAHEHRHEYQHEAIANPERFGISEEKALEWQQNFDDYISDIDDPEGYWNQPVERDAREFADKVVEQMELRRTPEPTAYSMAYTMLPNNQMMYTANIGDRTAYTITPDNQMIYTTRVGA